jgi:uncharacterized protein DUF5060
MTIEIPLRYRMHHLAFTICCGIFAAALGLPSGRTPAAASIHVWEKQELTFHSARTFANPYTDATVWVDLKGPGIDKRV